MNNITIVEEKKEEKRFNPQNYVWTEKYRPKKINEMVGDFKSKVMKYLENPKALPNFLLYSLAPGCGKTTLAKAIINELDCDALIINSSSDRKIETIRDKVKEFSMTQSTKKGIKRCVFLDEIDGTLKASQEALRNTMETYANNTFFILTANRIKRIIAPIQSRCIKIPFAFPNKEEIAAYLKMICESENMQHTDEALAQLVEMNYPSIRNCVLKLQDLHTEELDVTMDTVKPIDDMYNGLWEKLIEKDWKYIKKIVLKSTIDPRDLNSFFWEKALYSEPPKLKIVQLCCRNEKDIAWGADGKIVVVTSLIEMCK